MGPRLIGRGNTSTSAVWPAIHAASMGPRLSGCWPTRQGTGDTCRPNAPCMISSTAWATGCGGFRRPSLKKRVAETDAIFDNLRQVHAQAAQAPETLRISLDTKAKVKIGEFSRRGVARGQKLVRAADHDMHPEAVLAPAGILEVDGGQLNVVFGTSRDTSDFVADCLELWWANRQAAHPGVRRLLIDLDNGPEIASSRTQFMKRLVEFADRHQLTLELAYYPPYHSKYNPIERCWGILESHWNGTC